MGNTGNISFALSQQLATMLTKQSLVFHTLTVDMVEK